MVESEKGPECPEARDGRHCWHGTGMTLLSNPPQYPQVCCYCNANQIYRPEPLQGDPSHGKFSPDKGWYPR